MGYLKDIYDILKDEPEARDWVIGTLGRLWNGRPVGPDGQEPTHVEAINAEREFANGLRQKDVVQRFKDRLSILGFVLLRSRSVVDLKERGLVLRRFYLESGSLYFPPSNRTVWLARRTSGRFEFVGLADNHSSTALPYEFYYVEDRTVPKENLVNTLDGVAEDHKGAESQDLFKALGLKTPPPKYRGVLKDLDKNSFTLKSAPQGTELPLIWKNADEVRNTIADDLLHVLDWTGY